MPIFAPEHFDALLQQARDGSRDAVGKLLEPFRMYLMRRPLPRALQPHVEEAELVQDTFHAAVGAFAEFRGSTEAELFAWLRQILRNRAQNLVDRYANTQKRAGRPVSLDGDFAEVAWRDMLIDDDDTPCTFNSSRELRAIMQRALLELKPEYQEVITLHYGADQTFADIAVAQGKTTDAVIKTWKRALKAWQHTMVQMGMTDW